MSVILDVAIGNLSLIDLDVDVSEVGVVVRADVELLEVLARQGQKSRSFAVLKLSLVDVGVVVAVVVGVVVRADVEVLEVLVRQGQTSRSSA